MPVSFPKLDDLDKEIVDQALLEIKQRLSEKYSSLDLRRGAIHDLILVLSATLLAAERTLIRDLNRSASLARILDNPELADEDIVDDLMSNYRITRKEERRAEGQIYVRLSKLEEVSVAAGTTFVVEDVSFSTKETYTARTSEDDVVTDSDRLIRSLPDGTYQFVVDVVAVSSGSKGNVAKDKEATPLAPIPNFLSAATAADFTGGRDRETNQEIANRQLASSAARGVFSQNGIEAMLRDNEDFEDLIASSAVGFADAEQRRYGSIFPVAFGGRADIYLRTAQTPSIKEFSQEAILVDADSSGGIWQITIDKDDAPGFYLVDAIHREDGAGPYEVVEDVRGYDLSDADPAPDIPSNDLAAYSRYQTAVIRFRDTDTTIGDKTIGSSTQKYTYQLVYMPKIDTAQDFLDEDSSRYTPGDVLVRAGVPCFVTINAKVHLNGKAAPNETEMIDALKDYVNTIPFTGRLSGSKALSVLHDYIEEGQSIQDLDLFGKIRGASGVWKYLRSRDALEVPSYPEELIGPKTVAFILESAAVNLDYV